MKRTKTMRRNGNRWQTAVMVGAALGFAGVFVQGQGLTALSFIDAPTVDTVPVAGDSWVMTRILPHGRSPLYRLESVMVALESREGEVNGLSAVISRPSGGNDELVKLGPPEDVGGGLVRFGGQDFVFEQGRAVFLMFVAEQPLAEGAYNLALAPPGSGEVRLDAWANRGQYWSADQGQSWNLIATGFPKFAITVTPVPEPSSVALLGLGLGWLWLRKRQRRARAVEGVGGLAGVGGRLPPSGGGWLVLGAG